MMAVRRVRFEGARRRERVRPFDDGQSALFGGGVGSNDYALPAGVAMKLRAGEQILLNLHLFNASEKPLEGTSGVLVRVMPEEQVEHFAEAVLAGTIDLDIEPGRNILQSGSLHDVAGFDDHRGRPAYAHARRSYEGRREEFDRRRASRFPTGTTASTHSSYIRVDTVQMKAGDVVYIDCTYDNMSDHALHFGNSSLDEMCFAELLRYPVSDKPMFVCAN